MTGVQTCALPDLVKQLPDAPLHSDFLEHYVRVAVLIERYIGGSYLVHPYVPSDFPIHVGDIVDVPMYVGGPRVGKFSGRPQISRVVCVASDQRCIDSDEGRARGVIGPVPPRD